MGYEVKEALRAKMEEQSKLHLQVVVIFVTLIYIFTVRNLFIRW